MLRVTSLPYSRYTRRMGAKHGRAQVAEAGRPQLAGKRGSLPARPDERRRHLFDPLHCTALHCTAPALQIAANGSTEKKAQGWPKPGAGVQGPGRDSQPKAWAKSRNFGLPCGAHGNARPLFRRARRTRPQAPAHAPAARWRQPLGSGVI